MIVTIVSLKVFPVRYVNQIYLPYVEMWNCYEITRSRDLVNCV